MQEEAKNEGTRSKGIFSDNYLNLSGGGGGACGNPSYPSAGYPPQHGLSYSQHSASYAQNGSSNPHHGYTPPPLPTYPSYGYPQPCYRSPPPALVEAYNPYNYGHAPYGPGKHQQQHDDAPGKHQQQHGYAPGKNQQQHVDYYHRHEEFNMYEGYAQNNHGYGRRRRYGMFREVPSDAKV